MSTYVYPLSIRSSFAEDADIIERLTKGRRNLDDPIRQAPDRKPPQRVNAYHDIATAAGVCADIRRHLADPAAHLEDANGVVVPDDLWLRPLRGMRNPRAAPYQWPVLLFVPAI